MAKICVVAENKADIKVFKSDRENKSDLLVFVVDRENKAKWNKPHNLQNQL